MIPCSHSPTFFPYTTLFRSEGEYGYNDIYLGVPTILGGKGIEEIIELDLTEEEKSALDKSAESVQKVLNILDRKSTRLNSSHVAISYAVFCLKKKIQRKV